MKIAVWKKLFLVFMIGIIMGVLIPISTNWGKSQLTALSQKNELTPIANNCPPIEKVYAMDFSPLMDYQGNKATISTVTWDTNSMLPTLNRNSIIALEAIRTDSDYNFLEAGNIIEWNPKFSVTKGTLYGKNVNFYTDTSSITEGALHRIIEIGTDSQGWYAITKGDHNLYPDGKIRIGQVKSKVIAVMC